MAEREIEADNFVAKWGIKKELKTSLNNHLDRDGEWQKRVRERVEKDTEAKGE